MTTKWFIGVSMPNPRAVKYRPLYEIMDEGHLRIAGDDELEQLNTDEILFFDTYNQAEEFAKELNATFGYFTQVIEYVS